MPLVRFGNSALEVESVVRVINKVGSVVVVFRDGAREEFGGPDVDAFRDWVRSFPDVGSLASGRVAGASPAIGPAPGPAAGREGGA